MSSVDGYGVDGYEKVRRKVKFRKILKLWRLTVVVVRGVVIVLVVVIVVVVVIRVVT